MNKSLEQFVENSPLGYLIWNKNFEIQSISDEIIQWTGLDEEKIIGENFTRLAFKFLSDCNFLNLKQKVDELTSGKKESNEIEFGFKTKYQGTKYLKLYNSILSKQYGERRFLSFVEDQTSLVKNTRTKQGQYEVIEKTSDIVLVTDSGGCFKYLNPSGRKKLNLSKSLNLETLRIEDFVSGLTQEYLNETVLPSVASYGSWEGEFELLTLNNKEIPVSAAVNSHKDNSGVVKLYSFICRDVSAKKKYLSNIKTERQKLELAKEGGGIGFWHYFPKEKKLEFDKGWLRKKLKLNNMPSDSETVWKEIIHPEDLKIFKRKLGEVIQNERKFFKEEVRLKKDNGEYLWVLCKAKSVSKDRQNQVQKISGIKLDIHDRKRNEIGLKTEKKFQTFLNDIASIINCNNVVNNSLKKCLERVCQYLEWPYAHLIMLSTQKDGNRWQQLWHCNESVMKNKLTSFPNNFNKEIARAILRKEKPFWVTNLEDYPIYYGNKFFYKFISTALFVPVQVGAEPAAFFCFYHSDKKEKNKTLTNNVYVFSKQIGYLLKRKKSIEKLKRQEKKFRYVVENSSDQIVVFDFQGRCIYASPSTETILGYNPKEFKRLEILKLIHPSDLPKIDKVISLIKGGQSQHRIKLRCKRKDNSYVWLETSLEAFYSEDNEVKEIHTSSRDITKRVHFEEKIKKKNAFTEHAINSIPGLFFVINKEGKFLKINNGFKHQLGYDEKDLKKMTPSDFYNKKDQERISQAIKKAFRTGENTLTVQLRKKNNSNVWFYIKGVLIKRGGKEYILGTGINISKRIHLEKRLKKREELFSKLFKNSPFGSVMLDSDEHILDVNDRFQELFGYAKENIIGKDINSLIIPDERKAINVNEFFRINDPKTKISYKESVREGKNGSKIPVMIGIVPVVLSDESNITYVMYVDITERKKYLQKIEQSLKEKKVLLQEIHHRVKNNMAVISSFLQLQKFNVEDETTKSILRDCEMRIQTMALIHEKLYQSDSLSEVNMDKYLNKLVDQIKKACNNKDIQVNVCCDSFKLSVNQAVPCALVTNELVTNAFEHAFNGQEEGRINIKLVSNKEKVILKVEDDGVGMKSETDNLKTLGFDIVNTLTDQLEGNLEIFSNETGTDIQLTFKKVFSEKALSSFVN